MTAGQAPCEQLAARVSWPFAQLAARHEVVGNMLHSVALAVVQVPAHTVPAPGHARGATGWPETCEHVPRLFGRSHAWQRPVQDELQQ